MRTLAICVVYNRASLIVVILQIDDEPEILWRPNWQENRELREDLHMVEAEIPSSLNIYKMTHEGYEDRQYPYLGDIQWKFAIPLWGFHLTNFLGEENAKNNEVNDIFHNFFTILVMWSFSVCRNDGAAQKCSQITYNRG